MSPELPDAISEAWEVPILNPSHRRQGLLCTGDTMAAPSPIPRGVAHSVAPSGAKQESLTDDLTVPLFPGGQLARARSRLQREGRQLRTSARVSALTRVHGTAQRF